MCNFRHNFKAHNAFENSIPVKSSQIRNNNLLFFYTFFNNSIFLNSIFLLFFLNFLLLKILYNSTIFNEITRKKLCVKLLSIVQKGNVQ